jgi:hypothetical protein
MRRVAFVPVVLCSLVFAPAAVSQTPKPAPATSQAAAPQVSRARLATPVKGTAYIEVISSQSKLVGSEIVTLLKIKNVSAAPIAGLRIDQFWYDAKTQVTGDVQRVRTPIAPGEVVEVTMKAPNKPGVVNNRTMFVHANGKVDAKGVKKFTEPKKK